MRLVGLFAVVLSLSTTQTRSPESGATAMPSVTLPAELDRVLRDYERAWRSRDPAALATLFAEDGFVLANTRPPVRGREAIRAAYAQNGGALELRALSYALEGAVGYIIGAYGPGTGHGDTGKFILALQRGSDGRWLIAADMDNANRSPMQPLVSRVVASRANQWLLPYVKAGDFSGVVLIAQGEKILFEQAYGKADFERRVANELSTRFRLASLSKTFTAAAIELLIKKGQLRLSDTLDRFIEGIPNGDKITIAHLLLHQSGVGRFTLLKQDCLSEEEWIEQLRKSQPSFAPGTSSSYSNEGYFLLAVILEKVSGISYSSFLAQNIFGPLGMRDSGSACKELPSGNNATGYLARGSVQDPLPVATQQAVPIGPGSIFSTARDLHHWLRAVGTNPQFQVDGLQYPYGWGKRNFSGRNLIEQSGIVEGFNAHMAIYPTEHLYCVVLGNIQSGFFNRIEKDLESVLFGGDLSRPPQVSSFRPSANALSEYTGTYKSTTFPVAQILSVRGRNLYMQWADTPFLRPLISTAKDSFFYRVEYAEVTFERDKGQISKSTWRWPQGDPLVFDKGSPADAGR